MRVDIILPVQSEDVQREQGGDGSTLDARDAIERAAGPGFFEPGWEPEGEAASHGRGGARRLRWGSGVAFYRPLRHGGLLASLLGDRYLSIRRLRRELDDAVRLRAAGVRVPEPIVGRCERVRILWKLALIAECLEGQTLDLALAAATPRARRALVRAAGTAVARMHEAGFAHSDLHPGNLFVLDEGAALVVLDLTNGSWGLRAGSAAALRSLVRCARWWHKHHGELAPTRDVLAFLGAYAAVLEPDPGRRRLLQHGLFRRGSRHLRCALALRRRTHRGLREGAGRP